MKKKSILFVGFILFMTLLSCEREGYKGLDGMWQLRSIETLADEQTVQPEDVYYSFQLQVVNIRKIHLWQGYASFVFEGDSIHLTARAIPQHFLQDFGLNSPEESFAVERLNSSQLVLRSDYARLMFRKY